MVGEFLLAASALPVAAQPGSQPPAASHLPALLVLPAPHVQATPTGKMGQNGHTVASGHRQGGMSDGKKQSLGRVCDAVPGVKHAVE